MTTKIRREAEPRRRPNMRLAETLGTTSLAVCVYCSARELDDRYTKSAAEVARLLAASGHSLVWGGSNTGTMRIMADGMQAGGAEIHGVSVNFLNDFARPDNKVNSMEVAESLIDRIVRMREKSDVLLVLPGGVGTWHELTEAIESKKHGYNDCPIYVLNTDGFYDGTKTQLERMATDGMLPHPVAHYITFFDQPAELVAAINELAAAA